MLKNLVDTFRNNEQKISEWFDSIEQKLGQDPIYASVDLRNAGFKVAPVDTNIFPGGFNNLCPAYRRETARLFKEYIEKFYLDVKSIAILAEEHTRNTFYFEHLFVLSSILESAGFSVQITSLSPELSAEKNEFETSEKNKIVIWKAHIEGNIFKSAEMTPDLVLVNNDFSAGVPDLIKKVVQPLVPSPMMGWHSRRKSDHFACYEKLAHSFANVIGIDPWLISAQYRSMDSIDFSDQKSLEELAQKVDDVLKVTREKYSQYNIKDEPFVFVKNDAGTYGMAVMVVHSGEELLHLNKKERANMKVGKNLRKVTQLIIQEGVPTLDRVEGDTAEPVMYIVHHQVCGGFFRIHPSKDDRSNLNSPGMKFSKMCFHEMLDHKDHTNNLCGEDTFRYVYKTIARLASYAAGCEIKQITNAL